MGGERWRVGLVEQLFHRVRDVVARRVGVQVVVDTRRAHHGGSRVSVMVM